MDKKEPQQFEAVLTSALREFERRLVAKVAMMLVAFVLVATLALKWV